MTTLLIIADGVADEKLPILSGKTPLEVAHTPYLDLFAKEGINGTLLTVADGIEVNSDTATLSILGYDITQIEINRAYYEALPLQVPIDESDHILRCNFITIEEDRITDFTAQHISTLESTTLIEGLNELWNREGLYFYVGDTYKHIVRFTNSYQNINAHSPHNAVGKTYSTLFPYSNLQQDQQVCEKIKRIMCESHYWLEQHPINSARKARGLRPANAISLWSYNSNTPIAPIFKLYPNLHSGTMITGTNLLKGIGLATGLDTPNIAGATGGYDTDYLAKVTATIASLEHSDFVVLHIEASDIASHDGDVIQKIACIEKLDKEVIAPLYKVAKERGIRVGILPDHATSCLTRQHFRSDVPFIIYNPLTPPDAVQHFNERAALQGSKPQLKGDEFIRILLG